MSVDTGKTALPGSDRQPMASAVLVGPADPNEQIEVTVMVRPNPATNAAAAAQATQAAWPGQVQRVSREAFAAVNGADSADLTKIQDFARANNLNVLEVSAPRRSIRLGGTTAAFSAAFGIQLNQYKADDGTTYRGRVGPIMIPNDLLPIIQAVLGLDNRPQADTHLVLHVAYPHATSLTYSPVQVAQLYNFPKNLNGQGQCVGIIELGGGFKASELQTYFTQAGVTPPNVSAVLVDGGTNNPGADQNSDTEVMLDIEVVGTVAPGAKIVVYFAPNTDSGFLDAITTAIHDTTNKPSVISISWGGPESSWTGQALTSYNQAFQDAATLGVTVCCSSGDNGSSDGVNDGLAHVDFPASSPFALACGGTSVQSSGGALTGETVWSDSSGATGGGVSDSFPLPVWQAGAGVPPSANANKRVGRGSPDVAGNADPATGYSVLADGQKITVGGTSAVSPLWAGLIACLNQQLPQSVGYLNPLLYSQLGRSAAMRDITSGNNGAYKAGAGWDACTGFGSPDGTKLLQALSQSSASPSPSPTPLPSPTPTPVTPPASGNAGIVGLIMQILQFLADLFKSIFTGK